MKNLNEAGYRKNVDSGQRLPYIKNKMDPKRDKCYWTSKIIHEIK